VEKWMGAAGRNWQLGTNVMKGIKRHLVSEGSVLFILRFGTIKKLNAFRLDKCPSSTWVIEIMKVNRSFLVQRRRGTCQPAGIPKVSLSYPTELKAKLAKRFVKI
jgi:hypothetical protein